ncbi:MAG: hypothetical protein IPM47_08700 [Sphingobacteriales bacterium]|nr:MAG: hypothetical protein IPM47_08700 [Sphingobacteriales bacterium]
MTGYENMPPSARTWIYQSSRPFTSEEIPVVNQLLEEFATQWVRHGKLLKSWAGILHRQFIVLMVDEEALSAGGCSIDASTRMLKQIEHTYQLNLFDRLTIAYRNENGQIATAPRHAFEALLAQGIVTDNTPVFNNLISTKSGLETEWEVPLHQSWHKKLIG